MSNETQTAIHLLTLILGGQAEPTTDGLYDLMQVKSGNKKVILEHLKAIHSIFGKAIKDLEGDKDVEN